MGCVLEHRPLNGLARACRENVVYTYVELGRSVRGATVVETRSWTCCRSSHAVSLANFAIGLSIEGDASAVKDAVRTLCAEALVRPMFRVYRLPLDQPEDLDVWLGRSGFSVQGRLLHMACCGAEGSWTVEPRLCRTRDERRRVAGFAASQFVFGREPLARSLIVGSTVDSPHELWWVERQGMIGGAVMLAQTPNALGLYNLCVDDRLRGRGLGTDLVRWASGRAEALGIPLVLQCERQLAAWYESLGFQKIGIQQSWGL